MKTNAIPGCIGNEPPELQKTAFKMSSLVARSRWWNPHLHGRRLPHFRHHVVVREGVEDKASRPVFSERGFWFYALEAPRQQCVNNPCGARNFTRADPADYQV